MHVTIVGPIYPYRGGIAHYTAMLARSLEESGHQAQVISFRRQYPAWLYPGTSDKDPSQKPLNYEAEYLLDPLYPWTWLQAAGAIAAKNPALVVIQWWTTFWAVPFMMLSWLLKRQGLRVAYQVHNVLPHERRPWDVPLAKIALGQGQGFVVHTSQEQERLLELIPGASASICSLPVYSLFSEKPPSRSEARETLQLPQDVPILLFFGIVRPYKGLQYLLEALGSLRQQGVAPHLVIAGEFWDSQETYLALIQQLGISAQVRIEARYIPNEEMETLFAAADVMVAPYTSSTQSAVAKLALGFGLPLIISDKVAPGIPESHLQKAFIVPSENPGVLAEAIENFVKTHDPDAHVRQPAQNDWEHLVQAVVEIALAR